jgi:hypothetical protein
LVFTIKHNSDPFNQGGRNKQNGGAKVVKTIYVEEGINMDAKVVKSLNKIHAEGQNLKKQCAKPLFY